MGLGRLHARQRQVGEALSVRVQQGQLTLDALVDRRSGKACSDPGARGFAGDLLAELREGIVALGLVDMGPELRPFPPERQAPPHESTGGPHRRRRDRGLRQHRAPAAGRHLVRIDRVVVGRAALERLQGEGVPQNAGQPCVGTEISEPLPGEETLDSHHQSGAGGRHSRQERRRSRLHVAGHQAGPSWLTRQTYRLRACQSIPP
jgi:hypothetical protein